MVYRIFANFGNAQRNGLFRLSISCLNYRFKERKRRAYDAPRMTPSGSLFGKKNRGFSSVALREIFNIEKCEVPYVFANTVLSALLKSSQARKKRH